MAFAGKWLFFATEEQCFLFGLHDATLRNCVFSVFHAEKLLTGRVILQRSVK
jgi:hypothetical protein